LSLARLPIPPHRLPGTKYGFAAGSKFIFRAGARRNQIRQKRTPFP
jgi:hypothetical protein